ncbi:MAG: hypothetical protein ACYCUI_07845 [Vulcanimicrobiaceae bacterium]
MSATIIQFPTPVAAVRAALLTECDAALARFDQIRAQDPLPTAAPPPTGELRRPPAAEPKGAAQTPLPIESTVVQFPLSRERRREIAGEQFRSAMADLAALLPKLKT